MEKLRAAANSNEEIHRWAGFFKLEDGTFEPLGVFHGTEASVLREAFAPLLFRIVMQRLPEEE